MENTWDLYLRFKYLPNYRVNKENWLVAMATTQDRIDKLGHTVSQNYTYPRTCSQMQCM